LDFEDFDKDRDEVIKRAYARGVKSIINVSSSFESCRKSLELSKAYDGIVTTLGIHPHDADQVDDVIFSKIRSMAEDDKVVAIGEVGLDFYRDRSPRDVQISVFRKFIRLADELRLPLVIHNRRANDEVLSILKEETKGGVRGVMHCFAGDIGFLNKCLDVGLYISFTCNVTFKNAAGLREVAAHVPTDRLLLETDAPFLAPQPFRGKRNEPAYLAYLAEEFARIKDDTEERIAKATTENARVLFGLHK